MSFRLTNALTMLGRKELQRLKLEAYETFIVPISNSRMNHLKERGNDMIQERVQQEIQILV
jgi:hypothetical protein